MEARACARWLNMSRRAKAIAHGDHDATRSMRSIPCPSYRGLDRYDARKAVVADIDAEGADDQGRGQASSDAVRRPLERGDRADADRPMVCRCRDARKPAIEATRKGDISIVPETWKKTWFNWLENIQPWCVSRQLWWGHRIPAWYAEDGTIFVAESEEEARSAGRRPAAAAGRGRARHLVLIRPVAVRHARLARADRRPQAPLPQRRPHLRLRHPVLLGRADGDAGHRVHGRGAVEDALPPRPGPRRARRRKCPSPRATPSTRSA